MSANYVASGASGAATVNGDLDDGPRLSICHPEEDLALSVQEKKKSATSSTEKKRKDKIRYWINKIGEQLPPVQNPDKDRVGRSTLEIVEKAWSYIVQLKEAADPACRDKIQNTYVEEIKKLKNDLEYWKNQAMKLQQKLESADVQQTTSDTNVQKPVTTLTEKSVTHPEVQQEITTNKETEKTKPKTKKRNTISVQLENLKKQQESANLLQQQGTQEFFSPGMMGTLPMEGGAATSQQQMINQQMLMNSMMFGAGAGGVMVPNSAGGMVLANGAFGNHGNTSGLVVNGGGGTGRQEMFGMSNHFPGISLQGQQQVQGQSSDIKVQSAAEAGAGLLQLAMQDAGITPSSQSSQSEENSASSVSQPISMATGSNNDSQSSALHTLASIASNTQNLSNASQLPPSQVHSNSLVSVGGAGAPTATTQSINSSAPIMATGQGQSGINATMSNNGAVMNMPFMNGQGNILPNGQNPGFNPMAPTQQIMFINEQGVPCVANIPLGIDPASLGIPNNAKQIMGVDKSGNLIVQNLQKDQGQVGINDQALFTNQLAQQQMNFALQGQFQGQNSVAIANPSALVQPPMNNQIQMNPQMMQPMGGQLTNGQLTQTNQGLIVPASQTGNLLTVNSVPTQSQLPQALLLPNGQIIPVVSNPNLVSNQQGQVTQMITGGSLPQRMPLPQGMVQNDANTQVIMSSAAPVPVSQPIMSVQQGGGVSQSVAPPTCQGLLMTTSSLLPVSPVGSSSIAGQATTLVSSTIGGNISSSAGSIIASSTSAQVGQGSKGQGFEGSTPINSTSNATIFSSAASSETSMATNSQVMTLASSDTNNNGPPVAILNPQLQSQLSGQLSGSTAPILLTMNNNGQATSIVVDPTTMHVLCTVQTPQPVNAQTTQPTTSASSTPPGKKGKKNLQRAICPKPQGNKGGTGPLTSVGPNLIPGLLVPTSAPPQGMWIAKEGEQAMDIVIPSQPASAPVKKASKQSRSKSAKAKASSDTQGGASTNSGQPGDSVSASETDILAKAAESIFSSEISPGNFYNPANEDNPLQIDTSICDGEEENSASVSPKKDFGSNKEKTKNQCSNIQGEESEKTSSVQELPNLEETEKRAPEISDSISAEQRLREENEILDMFKDTRDSSPPSTKAAENTVSSDPLDEFLMELKDSNPLESPRKGRRGKKNEKDKDLSEKLRTDSAQKESESVTIHGKRGEKEESVERQQGKDMTIDLPDTITFSANDLPDVLDQVEQLGHTVKEASPAPPTKRSKSKKGRSDNTEQEPANKKRKKNSGKDKTGDSSTSQPSDASRPVNSMSVYDFDEEDFSTPLFQMGSSRIPNSTNTGNKSQSIEKTPTTSTESPLFSMPILSEPAVNSSPVFEDITTPKKRSSKQRSKKNDTIDKSADVIAEVAHNSSDKGTASRDGNQKSKDAQKSDSRYAAVNMRDKLGKKNDVLDSFGFDDIHSASDDKIVSNRTVNSQELSPLFGSSEPKSRKIEKEAEKPNLNEPLFGAFTESHYRKKHMDHHGSDQSQPSRHSNHLSSDLSQQNRDVLPPVPTSNPLTLETADIDTDVNNILGLSPRMISPTPSLGNKSKQMQKSPQLQTPKSTSPVARVSPIPMATSSIGTTTRQSQILPSSNEQIMSNTSTTLSSVTSSSEFSYSTESLFMSQNKPVGSGDSSLYNRNINSFSNSETMNTISSAVKPVEKTNTSRPKSIYSAENFVQSSRSEPTNPVKSSLGQPSSIVSPTLPSYSRSGNDNTDGFNFASIGRNLSTPTTTSNSFIDGLSMSPIVTTCSSNKITSSEFTFTLTTVTSTVSTSSVPLMSSSQTTATSSGIGIQGQGQGTHGSSFPFYAPQQSPQRSMHQSPKRASQPQPSPQHRSPQQPKTPATSASPQRSGGQMGNPHQTTHRSQVGIPNFDLDLPNSMSSAPGLPPPSVPSHDGSMTQSEREQRERIPAMSNISDSPYTYGLNSTPQPLGLPSQRQRDITGPPPREEPPMFPNITVSTHEGPLNMGINKSHSEMRNSHKRINEMNQRNVTPKSQTNDVRNERTSGYGMQPFYAAPNFSPSSNPLETAPLHHPPLMSGEERPNVARSYDPIFPPSHSQGYNPVGQNFNNRYESNSITPSFPPRDSSGTQPLSHTPPSQNMEGRKSANPPANQNAKQSKSNRPQQIPPTTQSRAMNGPAQNRSGPTPPQVPPNPTHRPTPPHPSQQQPAASQSRPKSTSRSSKQSQKKKVNYGMESDLPPHPAMFDPNRSLTPFLSLPAQALSPPSRNMQNDGPSIFGPGNLFGSSSRKSATVPQNSDLGTPFNPLFPGTRPQNGLGFPNFQPGFGMNSMHGPMSNSPQITPHSGSVTVTPHMSNFTFPNIFSDPNNSSQNELSPIKFPPNPMLPHQGMDPNSLHHAHQQTSSLYHQHRTHPPSMIHNAMNINSILGHNHHSFESRGMAQSMNTSVAPPFPGHSHPASFAMPPLNFSMHDH